MDALGKFGENIHVTVILNSRFPHVLKHDSEVKPVLNKYTE